MPFHDANYAESQLQSLMQRGRWEQAIAVVDAWVVAEPWRAELLLRKAHLFRLLRRFDHALAAVRAYRSMKPTVEDTVFLEIEYLLDMGKTAEALAMLDHIPANQRSTSQAYYFRGRALIARQHIEKGLQYLWNAYLREPGYNRALLDWASIATRYYGKWVVRRELSRLNRERRENPTISVSVGLALNMIDSRYGHRLLRRAVERYTDDVPTALRRVQRKSTAPERTGDSRADAYSIVSEQLLAGHFDSGLAAYYNIAGADQGWSVVLASLAAEVLVDELVRPEEARLLLEDALRREPTDYRLHISYTKVFLKLGFGEEALSSANCALALAPEHEQPIALVQRAAAQLLLKDRTAALEDLRTAVTRLPEVRDLINQEQDLRPLLKDYRVRQVVSGHRVYPGLWGRILRWFVGD